ncbi:flagellar hook-associated protein FlgK [methanotrophic endosymbiont of Bathymodiolus puteoserpentis (Logatchev)]|jgi:flagellar hook-associated protein 1 FlgK|uniref:flagellar hook-associated protein FlgK n=1 Tax=methanotrophic endosymbiont of Bathymodiolus puteoserpentis (Logatchev) TaxID=343235 RepID=UPI0013C61160|nr:flagellar hook-associated protein FlgK [methanotrophic endosymbiont of Bathymodiolus puteoserpentis (Logatchev)]SHE22877.1 Flagellar hook-associated protein FlgK [methanotrophic endosymbiont of Bathymodiolus puteoserpentis (Logatchev)]
MANGILGTAVSGLMAFQRSIETTSNNIANANTEGYSRQRVESVASLPEYSGGGYIGTGVQVSNITRSYDQFISGQLRSSTSAFGEVDSFKSYAAQIDNLLADPTTGMDPAMQSFFNSVNDVANDPSSIAAREVMLTEGASLTHRFGMISNRFDELKDQVNSDLKSMTQTANSYTVEIAALNKRIATDIGRANGQQLPNDLLDQRDNFLNKLADLVDVSVIPQANGMVSVLMSNGLPLVMDAQAATLGIKANDFDPTRLDVTYTDAKGQEQMITDRVKGGKVAGDLRFRAEILDPAQQKLGAVAAAIAIDFNAIHGAGYDLDGALGGAFFKFTGVPEVPAIASSANLGTATVTAAFGTNSEDLNTSDYLLELNAGVYTLTRLSDDSAINLTNTAGVLTATSPDVLPGITLTITAGAMVAGDQFFIRPTYQAASNLAMNIEDPRKIAAATNLDADGITLVAGAMPGDNRNALNLAGLANSTGMFNGTASFQESYGQIIAKVGGLTHAANISADAQQSLLNRATGARENLAGVNLDEEAANLIKFQQSYQAAAQAISTASTLFDTLIGAVR